MENKMENKIKNQFHSNEKNLYGLRLLLVEDNFLNIMAVKNHLKKWNIDIDFAENGKIAVEKVQKNNYEIILMDIQMPVMNGIEASKRIRSLPNSTKANIPIIALTASILINPEQDIKDAGVNDVILKPFNPSDLFNKIKKYAMEEVK